MLGANIRLGLGAITTHYCDILISSNFKIADADLMQAAPRRHNASRLSLRLYYSCFGVVVTILTPGRGAGWYFLRFMKLVVNVAVVTIFVADHQQLYECSIDCSRSTLLL